MVRLYCIISKYVFLSVIFYKPPECGLLEAEFMRIVSLDHLKENEVLGKPIYDEAGRILLAEGVHLTPFYINRLKTLGVHFVYINDDLSKGVEIEENISEKTRQMSKHTVKEMVDKYIRYGKVNNDGISKSVNSILDDILYQKEIMVTVSDIRTKDDNLYSHAVNVCVLSVIIGTHLGYNMLRLKDVAIGALLHDLGKIKLMKDKKASRDIKNEGELQRHMEKMHPKAGYDLLGAQNVFNAVSKVAVLMHHERVDGTGYPLGLKGEEIHEVAKLVSICDTFDNMVSGSRNSEPKPVYEVLEFLTGMSGTCFDGELVKKFVSHIAAFPTGSGVKLNSGERCLVIRQNKALPIRPVIRAIYDRNGNRLAEPYEIDLNSELTLFITGVCDL
jgi:HD-GYP domain-containing protein (c-di-GMP phosphodiesterase class II)